MFQVILPIPNFFKTFKRFKTFNTFFGSKIIFINDLHENNNARFEEPLKRFKPYLVQVIQSGFIIAVKRTVLGRTNTSQHP